VIIGWASMYSISVPIGLPRSTKGSTHQRLANSIVAIV
jgi:hypothetical protein